MIKQTGIIYSEEDKGMLTVCGRKSSDTTVVFKYVKRSFM